MNQAVQAVRHDIPTREGMAQVRVLTPTPHHDLASSAGAAAQGPPRGTASGMASGTVLLGHGAGGQRDADDLVALTTLCSDGWTVVLVDQPWRVAGRRIATAPPTLDRAWVDVLAHLAKAESALPPLPRPWVVGGRSAGARVACRTAAGPGQAAAIIALAFPLHPPKKPHASRAHELALPLAAGIPTLVVQGNRDPFGTPEEIGEAMAESAPGSAYLHLHTLPGTHSPSADLPAVVASTRAFLREALA